MLKRHNIVLNMVLLVLALCVVFFAYMPICSYAEDESGYGEELDWGYANADKGVKWTQYKDGDVVTLVLELTEDIGQSSNDDEVKAIRQLLGQDASTSKKSALRLNTTKIVVKEGITGIGWKALYKDTSDQPTYDSSDGYSVDQDQTGVFQDFNNLTEVVPCSSIKRIGWSAFRKCSKLESFDFTKCTNLEEIMTQAFNPCGLKVADLSRCSKLKTIRTSAFKDCDQLESVDLPDSLKVIGSTAFNGSGMKSVTIPGSVTEIYNKAFLECGSLETVVFEESDSTETDIYNEAFRKSGVKTVTFSKNVVRIRRQAFEDCVDLERVKFTDASSLGADLWLEQKAFNNDKKLAEVIDEKTKKLAFTKPAAKELFSIEYNNNVFTGTALLDNRVDLAIEVEDKTSDYNGETQNGYGLTDTDYVTATGLVSPDELTGAGYTPSSGKYKGSYGDGVFNKDQLEVKRNEYFTTDNYNPGTLTPGKLTINAVDLTIAVKDQEHTYNGSEQGEDNKTYNDGSKVDAQLKGSDTITSIKLNGHEKNAGVYTDKIVASDAAIGENGAATGSYNISYAPGDLTIIAADLTITVTDQEYTYNGSEQGEDNETYSDGSKVDASGLQGSDSITSIKLNGQEKNAGEYTGKIVASDAAIGTATGNYNISYAPGKLTIKQADLTITMADRTLPYSGQTQYGWARTDASKETVTGLVHNETVTITYSPSSGKTAGTYTNGAYTESSLQIKDGDTDVTENYNLTSATAGKLTIEKDEKELKVESASKDWDYDAGTHTYKVYTVTYGTKKIVGTEGQTVFTLSTGDKVTVTPTGKGASGVKNVSDSGANSFTWTVENEGSYTKGTDKVGTLTINQVDLTISMADRTLPYSGQTQYGWARTDAGKETVTGLVHNETVTITYSPSSGKTAGTYTNGAYTESSLQIKDGDTDVTENYNLKSATAGKLTIEKDEKELKVESASKDWDYDAGTHTYKVYTVTYGTKKIEGTEGQTVFTLSTGDKVTVTPTGKGASGVKNVSDSGANSFTWTVENEGSYTKGTDKVGTLTINKAPLTITTPSGTKVYDGTPITRPNGTVTGLVNGETATVTGTGSQTAVGSSQNGYKIVWGSAKEANYEIVSENLGTLTVTAAPGGGGNDGNAAAPATGGGTITPGTPEGEAIDDEPVPAADTPEEPQVIDDPDVPLADNGGWALVNLLCMLGTAGLFAAMLARSIRKRQEGERAGIIYVIAGLAVAVFSALIFFMTEDMKLPMIMTDKWTLLMAVILAVQLAVAFLFRVRTADEDEEE